MNGIQLLICSGEYISSPRPSDGENALRSFSGNFLGAVTVRATELEKELSFYVSRDGKKAIIQRLSHGVGDYGSELLVGDEADFAPLTVCDQGASPLELRKGNLVDIKLAIDLARQFIDSLYYGDDLLWEAMEDRHFGLDT